MKNAMLATTITSVASQPITLIGPPIVSPCITERFDAISMMTAITGAASTPFTTALQ